jgi:hypothetical protein
MRTLSIAAWILIPGFAHADREGAVGGALAGASVMVYETDGAGLNVDGGIGAGACAGHTLGRRFSLLGCGHLARSLAEGRKAAYVAMAPAIEARLHDHVFVRGGLGFVRFDTGGRHHDGIALDLRIGIGARTRGIQATVGFTIARLDDQRGVTEEMAAPSVLVGYGLR